MTGRSERSRCHRRRKGGFTLIELLVVVSIIALLISILLPSLKRAREQAKLTVCLANLKGIASASLVYATDDSTEAAVPVHWTQFVTTLQNEYTTRVGASAWGGKSGRGPEGGDPMWWGTKNNRGPDHRPLNKFIYKNGFADYRRNAGELRENWHADERLDLGTFRCPSDRGYTGVGGNYHYKSWRDSQLSSFDHYGNSYAANALWIGPGSYGRIYMDSNSPYLRPLSRIPNPANTLYYEENCGRFAFIADPQPSGCPYTPEPGVCRGWHGRDWIFNVAFADGHAAVVRKKGMQNPRLSDYPYSSGGGDLQGHDAHSYWQCVIIRGEGWQIDTLPSPPVATWIRAPSG